MPKEILGLSVDDLTHAVGYLQTRIQLGELSYRDKDEARKIEADFYELASARKSQQKATDLTEWCSRNLTRTEWNRLRVAIRKRRERWSKFKDQKTIVVSAKVHKLLSKIALRDNVTFCDVLETVLLRAANSQQRIRPKCKA